MRDYTKGKIKPYCGMCCNLLPELKKSELTGLTICKVLQQYRTFWQLIPYCSHFVSKAAAPAMYEALRNLTERIDTGLALGEKLDITPARQALALANSK